MVAGDAVTCLKVPVTRRQVQTFGHPPCTNFMSNPRRSEIHFRFCLLGFRSNGFCWQQIDWTTLQARYVEGKVFGPKESVRQVTARATQRKQKFSYPIAGKFYIMYIQ